MSRITTGVVAFLLAWGSTLVCYADTLTLKDGMTVEGAIVERQNEFVIVRVSNEEKLYTANEIASINGEKFVIVRSKKKEEPKPAPKLPEPVAAVQKAVMPQVNAMGVKVEPPDWLKNTSPKTVLYVLGGLFVYISFMMFLLMKIAEKTHTSNPWHAWLPLANLFLLVRVAGLNYVWMLAFVSGFVPQVGPYLELAALVYIWWHVALQRKYPGWTGPLVMVPLLGMIPMFLLAYRDPVAQVPEKPSPDVSEEPIPGPTNAG